MSDRITFTVPLPPKAIRSNSRYFWAAKVKAKQAYSAAVWSSAASAGVWGYVSPFNIHGVPWQRARVTFTWRAAGVLPDQANIAGNCKALLDIICCAPNTGKLTVNRTTYLGLIENDRNVELVCRVEKVAHRSDEAVVVEIERLG